MQNLQRVEVLRAVQRFLREEIYTKYAGTKESHEALFCGLADVTATIFLGGFKEIRPEVESALECVELSEKILAEMRQYANDKEYEGHKLDR